jgi:hypothetical protein
VANAFISFNTQTLHIKSVYTQQHCYVSLKTLYPVGIRTQVFSFLRRMRCPLRHASWYKLPKRGKYTKGSRNIPKGHKIYNKWQLNVRNGREIYSHFPFRGFPKYTKIGILGVKNIPSGTPCHMTGWRVRKDFEFAARVTRLCEFSPM